MAGAPKGNQNSAKGRLWRDAVNRALAKKGREIGGDGSAIDRGLNVVAEKFIEACANGEAWALKDLGDRLDGKPAQAVEVSGRDGGPIETKAEWTVLPVTPLKDDPENPEG